MRIGKRRRKLLERASRIREAGADGQDVLPELTFRLRWAERPSEFELQAYLYRNLREMGHMARGEVSARGTPLAKVQRDGVVGRLQVAGSQVQGRGRLRHPFPGEDGQVCPVHGHPPWHGGSGGAGRPSATSRSVWPAGWRRPATGWGCSSSA